MDKGRTKVWYKCTLRAQKMEKCTKYTQKVHTLCTKSRCLCTLKCISAQKSGTILGKTFPISDMGKTLRGQL